MTTAAELRATANLLEADGWCQGVFQNKDGRCVVDALVKVAPHNSAMAAGALRRFLGEEVRGLMRWNDTDGLTAAQVIAALRDCADQLDTDADHDEQLGNTGGIA